MSEGVQKVGNPLVSLLFSGSCSHCENAYRALKPTQDRFSLSEFGRNTNKNIMAADAVVLNYHDSLLRQSDLQLLQPGHWLNDRIIGFVFE